MAPAPVKRLALVRLAVLGFGTVYAASRVTSLTSFSDFSARSFAPVGLCRLLQEPLAVEWVWALWVLTVAAGACATAGAWFRLSAPVFAAALLWVTSYRNSWGMIFHTENLLVLHVLLLSASAAGDAMSIDARRRKVSAEQVRERELAGSYGWVLRAMCWVTVMTYFVAGVAKLRATGWSWGNGQELRTHIAYDAVRKLEFGGTPSALGVAMVAQPLIFTPLAWLTLAVELGAPLALFGRRWALVFCVLAWGFHAGVLWSMLILFPYPLTTCAYLSFFRVERLERVWGALVARVRGRAPSPAR